MASDQWHHLEGAYPRAGLFRAYFYDNFTQPIDAKRFAARLVLREEFDYVAKTARELATVKVTFDPNSREHRSDVVFTEYS